MEQHTGNTMKVLVLGVGDFFSRLYYSTSFLLLYDDNKTLLVDCPDPLRRMIYDAATRSNIPIDLPDIQDVVVTHVHGDHSNGLEGLGYFMHFVEKRSPTVYTIPEVADVIWEHKLWASMQSQIDLETQKPDFFKMDDYFKMKLLNPGVVNEVNGLGLRIRYTKHYVPCFGLKISYNGRCLGYSSDTMFDPEHISFLSDCDLILHETNSGGHTPYEKLLDLPEEIRNKMLLIHIPDDFDPAESQIRCAEEGGVYEV
jgi:ribonuclease BN (tRNA processing enzyme)